MTTTLRPEHEQLIAEVLRSGSYHSADEVIERSLELLHEHDQWLAESRAKIEEGYAAAQGLEAQVCRLCASFAKGSQRGAE